MLLLLLLLLLTVLLVIMAVTKTLQKAPYGLHNQGATCYLNSVLQLLFMTPAFHHSLNLDSETDQELKAFFKNLREGPCETKNITEYLEINDVHRQRDAAEYLELILSRMSPSASEIFRGELINSTKCSEGHSIIEETNPFWTLPLPLKVENGGHFSVIMNLERILEKKIIRGAYCNDCEKNTDAHKKCELKTTPQVLILLLKRFVFNFATDSHVKSDCSVEIPAILDIKEKTYALYGIVNHWGTLRGGHYTATVQSSDDKTWYEFSDLNVQKAEEQQFDQYRSNSAYLLTYREIKELPGVSEDNNSKGPNPEPPKDNENSSVTCTPRQRKTALIVIFCTLIVIALVLGLVLGLVLKK